MRVAERDQFGLGRVLYHPEMAHCATSISAWLDVTGVAAGEPDGRAIHGYLDGQRLPDRTVVSGVRALPPGHCLIETPAGLHAQAAPVEVGMGTRLDLRQALRNALSQTLASGKRCGLALSGGLDSALLLALLGELDALDTPVYVLATGMPGYCEKAQAQELAAQFGVPVNVIDVTASDFVQALPDAARVVEEPMFNLHPVAKMLLARAMAADGVELAITGDGADQVMRRDRSANYLPLCKALFDACSVVLCPPFLDPTVVAHLTALPPDPHKPCLRQLGERLGLPGRLVQGPKRGRLAPAMDLGALTDTRRIRSLAASLAMAAPALQLDSDKVLWTTLLIVLDHLGASPPSI